MAEIWTQAKQVTAVCRTIHRILKNSDREVYQRYYDLLSGYRRLQEHARDIADMFGHLCQGCKGRCCSYSPSLFDMFTAGVGMFGGYQDIDEGMLLNWIPPVNSSLPYKYGCEFLGPDGCGFDRLSRPITCAVYTCGEWGRAATPDQRRWMEATAALGMSLKSFMRWMAQTNGLSEKDLRMAIALR